MIEIDAVPVPCTQGYTAWVSKEDADRVLALKWCAKKVKGRKTITVFKGEGEEGKHKTLVLSRFIMEYDGPLEIDHQDGDGLNNCRSNLRYATPRQNMRNQRLKKSNTSGFKGVSKMKGGKWFATIRTDSRRLYLGSYSDPMDAARAYDRAAEEFHGEFAMTNKMMGLL